MKTKKILLAGALIAAFLFSVNSVMAQTTDQVTVNLKFQPVQSIVVTSSQKTVDLVYQTEADYNAGVSSTQNDHLTIFSTGGFQVTVKADGNFTRTGGGEIPVGDVKVNATNGTGNSRNYGDGLPVVALATTDAPFITSNGGGRDLKFNVTYDNTAGASDEYIDKYVHPDDPESVYTAEVTYTITTN